MRFGINCESMYDDFEADENGPFFDLIVFNFPHVDLGGMPRVQGHNYIKQNRAFVKSFLDHSRELLTPGVGGEVHITHKDVYPFSAWEVVREAKKLGYTLESEQPFDGRYWASKGYIPKRGDGAGRHHGPNDKFCTRWAKTYVFRYDD